jgi:hypothetical protein
VATIEHGDFEWDDSKAASNEAKHGVSFVEAATVFEDADFLVNIDPRDPARFIAIGFSAVARVSSSSTRRAPSEPGSSRPVLLPFAKSIFMPSVEDDDLELPELSHDWFQLAVQPNRRNLRRGDKRAVFIDDEIAA